MTLNSNYGNCIGVKKFKRINFETRHKPMKACARKKNVKAADEPFKAADEPFKVADEPFKAADEPLIQGEQQHRDFLAVCSTCKRINPPKVEKVPLKEEEHSSWLEFKKLDEGKPVHTSFSTSKFAKERGLAINVDHPFVSVVRGFATDAFNAVVHMYGKNNRHSIRDSEVTSCVYDNFSKHHYFYLTMEAIEEGILGVYDVIVACMRTDGSISLVRLELTDDRPTAGKIAMMLPQLISLRSEYKTMKGMEQDLKTKLKNTQKSIKGKKNKDRVHLKEEHKAIKEKCKMLYQHIQSQIPKTWVERSGPAGRPVRCNEVNRFATGLTVRYSHPGGFGYPTRGFNYCTRSFEFSMYAMFG